MSSMVGTLKSAFRVPELRKRMIFTLIIVLLYRIGSHIPVPGIDRAAFTDLIRNFGQLGQMMDIISGGALTSVSIFALGVQPYINASIIIQLLTVAIPSLERMAKEGESGRKKIQKITRYLMIGLAVLQSFAFWFSTRTATVSQLPAWLNAIVVIFSFTAGTALVTWLGEQVNDKGVGNGISVLIFVGIISRVPQMLQSLWLTVRAWDINNQWGPWLASLLLIVFLVASLALLLFVIFTQLAERRIPVQYSKRVVGRKQYGGQSTYLPIKVNQSGV
ncbi:MAG: preprotein translocase subunit SecY, partial [Clostridiaceae bacterium]|nr:preprotein translocase subunit SecY [Clostridiaceae bacterium]